MTPEFSVKYIADRFQLDFWELWAELEPLIPCRPETPENLTPLEPIAKLSTSAFLRCSDDDRAWWWRPDGDVQFSEEMCRWLGQLKAELDSLTSNETPNPKAFPRFLVETLAAVEKSFPNVVPFQEMFYDFLAHADDPGTWAAVRLLGNLKERYLTAQDAGRRAKAPPVSGGAGESGIAERKSSDFKVREKLVPNRAPAFLQLRGISVFPQARLDRSRHLQKDTPLVDGAVLQQRLKIIVPIGRTCLPLSK